MPHRPPEIDLHRGGEPQVVAIPPDHGVDAEGSGIAVEVVASESLQQMRHILLVRGRGGLPEKLLPNHLPGGDEAGAIATLTGGEEMDAKVVNPAIGVADKLVPSVCHSIEPRL